jgi:hypothetical protein
MNSEATNNTRTPKGRAARNIRRSLGTLAAAICAVAMITACGSSNPPSGVSGGGDPALEYARCLRAHGVPNFPDPSPHSGLVIPNDINPQSPAFRSAQQTCGKLAQGGGGQGGTSESRNLELLTLARCMRSHGVPNFADPTTSPPPPSHGNALGGPGGWLSLGTPQQQQSPAYKRAAAACGSPATAH